MKFFAILALFGAADALRLEHHHHGHKNHHQSPPHSMPRQALATINPHNYNGLVHYPSDKQYEIQMPL